MTMMMTTTVTMTAMRMAAMMMTVMRMAVMDAEAHCARARVYGGRRAVECIPPRRLQRCCWVGGVDAGLHGPSWVQTWLNCGCLSPLMAVVGRTGGAAKARMEAKAAAAAAAADAGTEEVHVEDKEDKAPA